MGGIGVVLGDREMHVTLAFVNDVVLQFAHTTAYNRMLINRAVLPAHFAETHESQNPCGIPSTMTNPLAIEHEAVSHPKPVFAVTVSADNIGDLCAKFIRHTLIGVEDE